jgi:YesN/AraC family two-component response regulator
MNEKVKVLIVDDNESTREGTARLLEYEDNIEIIGFAENGQEGVDRVRELQPQVVLMDIKMPIMNGIEATKLICQIAPLTSVIMVSVLGDFADVIQALRAGAVDYVRKPITSAELADAISHAYQLNQTEAARSEQLQALYGEVGRLTAELAMLKIKAGFLDPAKQSGKN